MDSCDPVPKLVEGWKICTSWICRLRGCGRLRKLYIASVLSLMYWPPESRWPVSFGPAAAFFKRKKPSVLFLEARQSMLCRKGHDWGLKKRTNYKCWNKGTNKINQATQEILDVVHGCVRPLCKTLELHSPSPRSAEWFSLSFLSFFLTHWCVFFIAHTRNWMCTLHQQNIFVNVFWHSEIICVKYWISAFHSTGKSKEMAGRWRSIDF